MTLVVTPLGAKEHNCDCCNNKSRSVWGEVSNDKQAVAVYFAHWTLGRLTTEHPGNLDLVIGDFADDNGARQGVSMLYAVLPQGGQFMVVDAQQRQDKIGELAKNLLARNEVVGTPLAERVFAITDDIVVQDKRIFQDSP